MVVYGMFHGLVYLPVLLSSIGPSPYDSAKPGDHKPQQSKFPVHPYKTPGDNYISHELVVTAGKPLGARPPSAQNGSVHIPPTDYEGQFITSPL